MLDVVNLGGRSIITGKLTDKSVIEDWQRIAASINDGLAASGTYYNRNALYKESVAQLALLGRIIASGTKDQATNVESRLEGARSILHAVAENDPDTCCVLLEVVDEIISATTPRYLTISKSQLLLCLHELALQGADQEVKSKAQLVLSNALAEKDLRAEFFRSVEEKAVFATVDDLQHQCFHGAPSAMESALMLKGHFLDVAFSTFPQRREETSRRLVLYIRLLRETIEDTNASSEGHSAISS